MTNLYTITREIQIDAAHRIPEHGSKCKHIHGHRYVIQATCEGKLFTEGAQSGMVMDFAFLKDEMMTYIDNPCDHGLLLYHLDPLSPVLTQLDPKLKIVILPIVPTAENLARYWYERLKPRVHTRSGGVAVLKKIRVYETPNCWADYSEQGDQA